MSPAVSFGLAAASCIHEQIPDDLRRRAYEVGGVICRHCGKTTKLDVEVVKEVGGIDEPSIFLLGEERMYTPMEEVVQLSDDLIEGSKVAPLPLAKKLSDEQVPFHPLIP